MLNHRDVVFLMPMAPGEAGIVLDNIASISLFYPDAHLVIVDDCTQDGTYETVKENSKWRKNVLLLRNERRAGYVMLINTVAYGLREILSRYDLEFVIRIDADCAIVGDGLIDAFRTCFAKCRSGMLGQHTMTDEGKSRGWAHMKNKILMDLLPIGLAKTNRAGNRWRRIRVGWPPYVKHFPAARRSRYSLAENIFGPCYAIHRTTLQKMKASGFLDSVRYPFKCAMHEDELLISLGVKSVGDHLHDISELGFPNILNLRYTTRPKLPPEELVASGAAVAHALKHSKPEMVEYRRRLSELRNQLAPTVERTQSIV